MFRLHHQEGKIVLLVFCKVGIEPLDRTFEREKLSKYVCWAGEIKESMYVLKVEKWERIRVLTAQGWARYRQVDWRLLKRGVARAIIYLAKFAHMRTVDSRLDVAIPFPDTKCSV